MYRSLVLLLVVSLSGCAFYSKDFVSAIEIEGTNYRPKIFDEGVFYVNDDPPIRLRLGCRARTTLGETMFLLIPFPILKEEPPHASIAGQQFSLVLASSIKNELDLSSLAIDVKIAGRVHRLRFVGAKTRDYTYKTQFEFAADLTCGEIQNGRLSIRLAPDKVWDYVFEFREEVQRRFAWHTSFVT